MHLCMIATGRVFCLVMLLLLTWLWILVKDFGGRVGSLITALEQVRKFNHALVKKGEKQNEAIMELEERVSILESVVEP